MAAPVAHPFAENGDFGPLATTRAASPDEARDEHQIRYANQDEERPCDDFRATADRVFAHDRPIADRADQRPHRERQLQAQQHLAPHEQLPERAVAQPQHAGERRREREPARDQPALIARHLHVQEAIHDDLTGDRAGKRRALARREQRDAEQPRGRAADDRRDQPIGLLDVGDARLARRMERRAGQHEDRGIDEHRDDERYPRVDADHRERFLDCVARTADDAPRLHDRRMQVEVVRHDGRADDAERQHDRILAIVARHTRGEAMQHGAPIGRHHRDLRDEAERHRTDQPEHDRLDLPEPLALQAEDDHRIERGEDDAPCERHAEQQLEGERAAQYFGDVARDDRHLGGDPLNDPAERPVTVVARLREIATGDEPEPHGERLQEDRGDARKHDDPQQRVAELGAGLNVGCPVAGIHVADRDEQPRAGESAQFGETGDAGVDRDAAFDFRRAKRCGGDGGERHGRCWEPVCVAVILRIRGDRPSWPSTHVGQSDRGFAKMTFPWKVAGWPLAGRRKRAWNRRTGMHSRM